MMAFIMRLAIFRCNKYMALSLVMLCSIMAWVVLLSGCARFSITADIKQLDIDAMLDSAESSIASSAPNDQIPHIFKESTQSAVTYRNGIQVLQSKLSHSSIQVELAQQAFTNVLVLYVSAQLQDSAAISTHQRPQSPSQSSSASTQAPSTSITSQSSPPKASILFSQASMRAYFVRQQENKQITQDLLPQKQTKAQNLAQPIEQITLPIMDYAHVRKSNYDFIEILQDFHIPTPTPNVASAVLYNISPFYYVASPIFSFYPLIASPFVIENPRAIAYEQEKRGARKVLLMNLLRESTLTHQNTQGGFIVIASKGITSSGLLWLQVNIADDIHRFVFVVRRL